MADNDMIGRVRKIFDFDPRTQDGLISITTWLLLVIYFLYIHLFIVAVDLQSYKPNYALYAFVLFVPAAVGLLVFSGDPIAHASNKEAKFFQSHFPDAYVAAKFKIDANLARLLWFKALDKVQGEGFVKKTYQRGYTCRLVYYSRRASIGFFVLASLTLALRISWRYFTEQEFRSAGWYGIWPAIGAEENWVGKIFYLAHTFALWIYLTCGHKPDASNPSGVWARWKEVNDRNRAWIDGKFNTLDDLKSFTSF